MTDLLIIAHELLCLVVVYTVFCRFVRMNDSVRIGVRFSFFLLGGVSCLGMAAPLAWGYVPDFFTLALLTGLAMVQWVTSVYWDAGVPYCFYKPECQPLRRQADRREECHG